MAATLAALLDKEREKEREGVGGLRQAAMERREMGKVPRGDDPRGSPWFLEG